MEPKNLLWFIRTFIVALLSNEFIAFWKIVEVWDKIKFSSSYCLISASFMIISFALLVGMFDFSNTLSYKIEEKKNNSEEG